MEITLYTKDDLMRLDLIKANKLLKERGYFHVWLSFVDPRTDCLVQDYFCFYPKPQPSYAGGGVIAEHKGLTLRIPYDLSWYAKHQKQGGRAEVRWDVTVMIKGEYVRKVLKIEVQSNIRLFDSEDYHLQRDKAF